MVKSRMNEIERNAAVAADGPVVSEGGRSPSTLSTGQRAAGQGQAIDLPQAALGIWRELTKDGHECSPAALGELAACLPREIGHA